MAFFLEEFLNNIGMNAAQVSRAGFAARSESHQVEASFVSDYLADGPWIRQLKRGFDDASSKVAVRGLGAEPAEITPRKARGSMLRKLNGKRTETMLGCW